jgi:hypothetical protein
MTWRAYASCSPVLGLRNFDASPTVISSHRETVLYRQLPGVAPTTASVGDPTLMGIAASMNNISSAMHINLAVRESRYAQNKKTQTVRGKYADRITDMLHLLIRLEEDDDLPEDYLTILAKSKSLSERDIFQREVEAAAEGLGLVHFQVTPSQTMTMNSLDLCAPAYIEIGTGILPLITTPADATSDRGRAAIMTERGRAETYDLSGGAVNGAISTTDAACMRNLKWYVAADWIEARMQLQRMDVMMGALICTSHPVLVVYTTFLYKYNAMEPWVWR